MRRLPTSTCVLAVLVTMVAVGSVGCGVRERDASPAPPTSQPGLADPGSTATSTAPAPAAAAWSAKPGVDAVGDTIDGSLVTPDGRTRTYHLYVPTTLPTGQAVPLLVGLHGGTGWGTQFQRSSGFDRIAEANGFLVVFPDGIGVGPTETLRTWNGGVCCGPAAKEDVDDVAFVSMLIDQVAAGYAVDPARVYAAGHSNGAVMAIRLACELADEIVAVGYQAGAMEVATCTPSQPVSLLHLHGEADENIPPGGGKGTKGISGVDWNPAVDGVHTIAVADDCPSDPERVVDPDHPDVAIQQWSPCADGTTVELRLVPGATHAWMGAHLGQPDPTGSSYGGYESSDAIWAFLAAHVRG